MRRSFLQLQVKEEPWRKGLASKAFCGMSPMRTMASKAAASKTHLEMDSTQLNRSAAAARMRELQQHGASSDMTSDAGMLWPAGKIWHMVPTATWVEMQGHGQSNT